MSVADIEPALSFCTHLVYGYADINEATHKAESSNPGLDLDQGKAHYRVITALKKKFPTLKVLLSVGGEHETKDKYLNLLESSVGRIAFINSAYSLVKNYEFDGLDLAWDFPTVKPKKIRGSVSSFFHKINPFSGDEVVDEKWEEHREEFTMLVRELKNSFRHDGYLLTTTVLPNVNASSEYEVGGSRKSKRVTVLFHSLLRRTCDHQQPGLCGAGGLRLPDLRPEPQGG